MNNIKYTRNCPKCNKIISHKTERSRNTLEKNGSLCKNCGNSGENNGFYGKHHTKESKEKARNSNPATGKKLTGKKLKDARRTIKIAKEAQMASGKNNYERWVNKYGIEEADRRDIECRKKHSINSSGKNNPMYGRPTPQGSGNGWACWYKNIHFRSLRELSYFIFEIEEKGLKWENGQSGKFKIPYIGRNGEQRTYRPDFFIEDKFLIEIKPKKLWNCVEVQLKKNAAEIFCKEKGFEYKLVDIEPNSEKLKEKYLNGEIKFVDKYIKRFEKYAKIKQ